MLSKVYKKLPYCITFIISDTHTSFEILSAKKAKNKALKKNQKLISHCFISLTILYDFIL